MLQKPIKFMITLGLLFVVLSFIIVKISKVFTINYEETQVNLLLDEMSKNKTKENTVGVLVAEKRDVSKAVMNLNRKDVPEIVEIYKSTIDAEIASALLNNIHMKKEKQINATITYRGGSFYEERSIKADWTKGGLMGDCEIVQSINENTMIGKTIKIDKENTLTNGFILFHEVEETFLRELLLTPCDKSKNGNSNVYSWSIDSLPIITTLIVEPSYGLPVQKTGTLKISTYNGEIQSIEQTCNIKFENGKTIIGTNSTIFVEINVQ